MEKHTEVFVGVDVAKARHAVAVAEEGRQGEVRYIGEIGADVDSVRRLVGKLEKRHGRLHFCYEAGPTGYGLYRQLTTLGHRCTVVAPSLIPRKPGDRVKTNRRDALQLARLLRAGELTAVWVPDEAHEAMRDLVRARQVAVDDIRRKRQAISSMMLRQGGPTRARRPGAHVMCSGCRCNVLISSPSISCCRNCCNRRELRRCTRIWASIRESRNA
jgi:transposase